MKIFQYTFDTEGGTDWTICESILANNRKEADEFVKGLIADDLIPSNYSVILTVREQPFHLPCIWNSGEDY